MEMAAEFFETSLQGRFGAKARDYLAGRSLSRDTQVRFRIGYAPPERFALRDHLAGKGVSVEMMEEAGLVITGQDVKIPYDRFRDRVMFPICDLRGWVIAFGGRAMSADVPAKYLNSPDTPLFNKGRLLYNYHAARQPAHDRGTVIAVEGYVDVISLTVAGFPHAVAPLGTALTEDQLTLLWRLAEEPILCFDGDKAGQRAAYRALDVALPNLTSGQFPALRHAAGRAGSRRSRPRRRSAAVERVLASARPLVDVLWARELEAGPLDTPERRAALERRLRESLALIRDETLKRYYREDVESRLSALIPDTRPNRFNRQGGGPRRDFQRPQPVTPSSRLSVSPMLARNALFAGKRPESPREAMILSTFLMIPELVQNHAETLADLELEGRSTQMVRSLLLDGAASGEPADLAVMRARLNGLD